MSPDPLVQFEADLQSYNRYSYVLNNPLRYTDPTGYLSWGAAGNIGFGLLVGAASTACVASGGSGCFVIGLMYAYYNTSAALLQGASFESIVVSHTINSVAGVAGGGFAGSLVEGAAAQIIGGAISVRSHPL